MQYTVGQIFISYSAKEIVITLNIEAVAFKCVRLISFHCYINGASLKWLYNIYTSKGNFCLTLCLELPRFEVYIRDVSFYKSGDCVDVVSVWYGPHLRCP